MHGSYAANMGMNETDLLIALGVRFDDRVTGRLSAFAPHAKVIHVDIDPAEDRQDPHAGRSHRGRRQESAAEAGQDREATAPEMKSKNATARTAWWRQIKEWKASIRWSRCSRRRDQAAAPDGRNRPALGRRSHRLQRRRPASDVGRAVDPFNHPRLWINSGGLGSMGFGLPSAIGAQMARPDKLVFCDLRRRRLPDVDSGTGDHRQLRPAGQDHRDEQRLPGHGPPVAGAVL